MTVVIVQITQQNDKPVEFYIDCHEILIKSVFYNTHSEDEEISISYGLRIVSYVFKANYHESDCLM